MSVAERPARMSRPKRARIRFLQALREGATVVEAANSTSVAGRTLYRWRKEDPEFAAAWDEAYEQGADALEHEATKRALAGSDVLLMFILKAKRPKFRDTTKHEVTGARGGPVQLVAGNLDLNLLSEEKLEELTTLLDEATPKELERGTGNGT